MALMRRPSASGADLEHQQLPPPPPTTTGAATAATGSTATAAAAAAAAAATTPLPPLLPFADDGPVPVVLTFVSLVAYGLLQERVMSRTFGAERERFSYAFFLVAANRLCSVVAALSLHALRAARLALLLQHSPAPSSAAPLPALPLQGRLSGAGGSRGFVVPPNFHGSHNSNGKGAGPPLGRRPRALLLLPRLLAAAARSLAALPPPAAPLRCYAAVALSNAAATACQYEALRYVSFIAASLAKTAKALPVLLWGLVGARAAAARAGGGGEGAPAPAAGRRRRHTGAEILQAFVLTGGCALFVVGGGSAGRGVLSEAARAAAFAGESAAGRGSSSSSSGNGGGSNGDNASGGGALGLTAGALLLTGYLAADGWTSTEQERLYAAHGMDEGDQLLHTSACSALLCCAAALLSGQLWPAAAFLGRHPDAALAVLGLSAASAATQVCISAVVRRHGALVFALMMTTRQLASVLLSAFVYEHALRPLQWVGVAVAFGALLHGRSRGGGGGGGGGRVGAGAGAGAAGSVRGRGGAGTLTSCLTSRPSLPSPAGKQRPGSGAGAGGGEGAGSGGGGGGGASRPGTAPSAALLVRVAEGAGDEAPHPPQIQQQQQQQQHSNKGTAGERAALLPITARA